MEGTLKICLIALTLSLANPEVPKNAKWLVKFITAYAIFSATAAIVFYNIYLQIIHKDLSKACENGILSLIYFAVTMKYIILLWHRETVKEIINIMRRDIEMFKELTAEEQKIVEEYFRKQNFVWKLWLFFCSITGLMFFFQSLGSMLYYFYIGDFKLVPLFDLVYPDFVENRKDNLTMFLLTYISLVYCFTYAGVVIWAVSGLGPMSMLHACLRLDLIERRFDKLYSGELNGVNERLNGIAKELQEIYNFVELIERCFALYYEFVLKLSTFVIPFTLYQLLNLLKQREFNLEFTTYIFTGITISACPCYYSDMLMEKGEDVRLAAYSCGWEAHYHRRVRSAVLLILIRMTKPVAIRNAFRTISLIPLSEMFQQAYAIFNLMNNAMN